MKILVVDDSITMRRIIVNHLNSSGYSDIVEAGNGVEALEKMSGVKLVLTDSNMPVMDGLSLVKEIRQSPVFREISIIMITNEGAQEEVLSALKEGVNDIVIKPFTRTILIDKVQSNLDE
ncbi:MAG: response regulator [Candidatus Electryonea clarkiae]|nr:response regulator [Candidatus Electryonea clarkiae]